MVVGTVATAGAVIATGGAAVPIVVGVTSATTAGAGTGIVTSVGSSLFWAASGSASTGSAIGAMVGAGGAAVTGGSASAVVGSAVGGALAGSAAAATGTAASGVGAGLAAGGLALGPIGWLALGVSALGGGGEAYTWDCWKKVLHDESPEPSEGGMLLKDVVADPRVKLVKAQGLPLVEGQVGTPDIVLENVWGEQFRVEFVILGIARQLRNLIMVVGVAAVVGALAIAAEAGSTYAYGTTASAGVGAVAGKNEVRRAAGAGIFMTVTEIMCLAYTSGIMGVIIGAGVAAKMQPHALSILLTAVLGAVASAAAAVGTSASHSGTARLKAAASNGRGALSRTEEGQVEGEARRLGPFAWLALGASELMPSGEQRGGGGARTTWDCWKPILHNESPEPSDGGVLLKDVVNDPRVRVVRAVGTTLAEGEVGMPDIVLENIWGEQFQIQIVSLADTLALAAHATRIPPVVGSS